MPANLGQPCLRLQVPAGPDGRSVYAWAIQAVRDYNDCADRVDALIEAWPR